MIEENREGFETGAEGPSGEGGENGDEKKTNLDITTETKKRIIRNPQPKLDPAKILGPRGVGTLEDLFVDFTFKGKGHEFEDIEEVLKKMEHWAHRLYPKLPFADVAERIAQLGKKKAVQVNIKKIRLGMQVGGCRDTVDEPEEDNAQGEEEIDDDLFDKMIREAEESQKDPFPNEEPIFPYSTPHPRQEDNGVTAVPSNDDNDNLHIEETMSRANPVSVTDLKEDSAKSDVPRSDPVKESDSNDDLDVDSSDDDNLQIVETMSGADPISVTILTEDSAKSNVPRSDPVKERDSNDDEMMPNLNLDSSDDDNDANSAKGTEDNEITPIRKRKRAQVINDSSDED